MTEAEKTGTMELTDREIAIAEGRDPDAVAEQPQETPVETGTEAGGAGSAEGTEAPTGAPSGEAVSEEPTEVPDAPEPEPAPEMPEWVNDDYRAMAASFGIGEDELSQFSSKSDFQRACRVIDRNIAAELKRAAPPEEKPPEPTPAVPSAPPPVVPTPSTNVADESDIDLEKYSAYDEETQQLAKVAKRLVEQNKAFRGELSGISGKFTEALDRIEKQRVEDAQARAQEALDRELDQFHDEVDRMDKTRFGGEDKLTPELDERRKRLFGAYEVVKQIAQRQAVQNGRPYKPPPMRVLLHRAELIEFGDEVIEATRKSIHKDIQNQSRRRRPAPGRGKVIAPPATTKREPQTPREIAEEILANPEVAAVWDRIEESTGT